MDAIGAKWKPLMVHILLIFNTVLAKSERNEWMNGLKTVVLLSAMLASVSAGGESAPATNQEGDGVKIQRSPAVGIGDTETDVLRIKGQPFGARTTGAEKILFYGDSAIVLENGRVSEINGADIRAPVTRSKPTPPPPPRELSAQEKRTLLLDRKAKLQKFKVIIEASVKRKQRRNDALQQHSEAIAEMLKSPSLKLLSKAQSLDGAEDMEALLLRVDMALIDIETELEKLEPELKTTKLADS